MTEREKADRGMLYAAIADPELFEAWSRSKQLCYEYNRTSPLETDLRDSIIRDLLGKAGDKLIVCSPFHCDYGTNIEIGDNFFSNMNLVILDCARVTIGRNVLIAPNVGIYTAGHPLDAERRAEGLEYARPVTIGDDVWIGAQAAVLPGVTIGDRSIIGAGSVVTKDIPSDVLAFGNPCRVVRAVTDDDRRREYFGR